MNSSRDRGRGREMQGHSGINSKQAERGRGGVEAKKGEDRVLEGLQLA